MNPHMIQTGLFLLAFVSAILNYAGFTSIIDAQDWWLKSLCVMSAVGVWVCLYLFWQSAFAIIPHLKMPSKRIAGWLTILSGCVVIVALSTYWNVIAYTGHEAERLALMQNITRAEDVFAKSIAVNQGAVTLLPRLEALAQTADDLAKGEKQSGAVSGAAGAGAVSSVLEQISSRINAITITLRKTQESEIDLREDGAICLSQMRSAVDYPDPDMPDELASGASCLNEAMAGFGRGNPASSIANAMHGLTSGVVLPVSIRNGRQRQAIKNALSGLQKQANHIAKAASALPIENAMHFRLERPNMATAVLHHWRSLIPAIATAIAIDLLPLVLLVMGVLYRRDAEAAGAPRHLWTMAELSDARDQLAVIEGRKPAATTILEPSSEDWWHVGDEQKS